MKEIVTSRGKRFEREQTELEVLESIISSETLVDSIGDLDLLEEVATELDSNLEHLLTSIKKNNGNNGFGKGSNGHSKKVTPVRKRILVKEQ